MNAKKNFIIFLLLFIDSYKIIRRLQMWLNNPQSRLKERQQFSFFWWDTHQGEFSIIQNCMIGLKVIAMYSSKLPINYLCLLVELLHLESAISWENLSSFGLATKIRVSTLHTKLEATLEGICYNLVFSMIPKSLPTSIYLLAWSLNIWNSLKCSRHWHLHHLWNSGSANWGIGSSSAIKAFIIYFSMHNIVKYDLFVKIILTNNKINFLNSRLFLNINNLIFQLLSFQAIKLSPEFDIKLILKIEYFCKNWLLGSS